MSTCKIKRVIVALLAVTMLVVSSGFMAFADSRSNSRNFDVSSSSVKATISSSTNGSSTVTSCTFTASPMTGISVTTSQGRSSNFAYGYFNSLTAYGSSVSMYQWPAKIGQHRWISSASCKLTWYSYSNGSIVYTE